MNITARLASFSEDLTDWLIERIKGNPKDIDEWQRQGVIDTINDEGRKQAFLTELSEIYFSFVMARLRIGEDFKREGKYTQDIVSRLDIYKAYCADFVGFETSGDYNHYKRHPLFMEIIKALGARYHYFSLVEKNRLLTYEMLDQYHVPLDSCSYMGKKHSAPLELRMFFKHAEEFICSEAVDVIADSYETMKSLHSEWIPESVTDTVAKKYYNERTCRGILQAMRIYWLDTAEGWSEYNIREGEYSVERRYFKNNTYQKEASKELDEWLEERKLDLDRAIDGEGVSNKTACIRPQYISLLDNGLLLWALNKMNVFGLFMDNNGQLLEPDIFSREYVPEFFEIDSFISCFREIYDGFEYYLRRNTGGTSRNFKELKAHYIRIYGNKVYINRKKRDYRPCKLSGGRLEADIEDTYSDIPEVFDMYLWKNHRDYYCGFINNAFRYLCLPFGKEWFMDPRHAAIYKPEIDHYSIKEKCS